MWLRYAAPAVGIIWSSHMSWARLGRRRHVALEARASRRVRPVNSEGRHSRSANDIRSAADRLGARENRPPAREKPPMLDKPPVRENRPPARENAPTGRPNGPTGRPGRPALPPDDRLTTVLPPVRDGGPAPLDVVRAAMDGTPPPKPPPPKSPPPPPPGGGRGSGPSGPSGPGPKPTRQFHINWKLVRRLSIAGVVAMILLPLVTFGMAYMIVDVP